MGHSRLPDEIREYWNERARQSNGRPEATTRDIHLRELEILTLARTLRGLNLKSGAAVLDVGCGDGYSTLRLAEALKEIRFEGIDYSHPMISSAVKRLEASPHLVERVRFAVGDATRIADAVGDTLYDVVMTDRCLINLPSSHDQYEAIHQFARHIEPGGCYLAIENFIEGHNNMNRARAEVGLPEIPVRWHNVYLREEEFLRRTRQVFREIEIRDFSSAYYYVTRVLYARMCKEEGVEPDYEHPIHRFAPALPWFGQFSPVRLAVLRKLSDRSAVTTDKHGFAATREANIKEIEKEAALRSASIGWVRDVSRHGYSYNFDWLGRPIIQFPQDIVAVQELIWQIKPDLIVETGIAHGGSLILSASILELLGGDGEVIGVDIEIREHNRKEIEKHATFKRITMIEGSSTDEDIVSQVRSLAQGRQPVMVLLDSSHTHDHVLKELQLYSPFVTKGSYLVVFDTIIEDMPEDSFPDRPWGKGNNPKTAVREFLKETDRFVVDKDIENKLLITVAPDGYLKCVKD